MTPSPVKEAARTLGIAVSHDIADLSASGAELAVVVAYGRIIPAALLAELPMVNLHFSLLPRWRGAAPVERAILAGDTETGVCIMALEAGLDTGPVYARAVVPIGDDDTAGDVTRRLVDVGTDLLVATLPDVPALEPEPQTGEPTYADKLTVDEFRLDTATSTPSELVRVVRAGNPRPGAWATVQGARVKVWRARVGDDGAFVPVEVQPEGKARMDADAWMRGLRERPPAWGT
jgi:methionyl-tRNA formyltransferase